MIFVIFGTDIENPKIILPSKNLKLQNIFAINKKNVPVSF
jgi:hypothetical protein